MQFEFTCADCGQVHMGMPTLGADRPLSYYAVPSEERERRGVPEATHGVSPHVA